MKKLAVFLCLAVFLSGCGGKNRELHKGMELRTKLLAAQAVSFDAEITADYGDAVHMFSMACESDELGNLTFSVTAPETVAGITGKIGSEGGALTFDGTALYFDMLPEGQISPISAPWILLKTLRSGYLTSAGKDRERTMLTIDDSYEDDALTLDIWLDDKDFPEEAEVLYKGRKILSLKVSNFVFQ